jgi:hypothetical protein
MYVSILPPNIPPDVMKWQGKIISVRLDPNETIQTEGKATEGKVIRAESLVDDSVKLSVNIKDENTPENLITWRFKDVYVELKQQTEQDIVEVVQACQKAVEKMNVILADLAYRKQDEKREGVES